jgi:SAM-dependent methyltransferase
MYKVNEVFWERYGSSSVIFGGAGKTGNLWMTSPMKFRKNANSMPHNWLIHHYQIVSVEKYVHQYIGGYVLDVGCGIKPYQEIIEQSSTMYIGLDYADAHHGFSQVDVIGSALNLPFADESFDSIVSFQVMEHVPEPVQFLSEIRRVLKKSGYALITTPFMWGEHEQPYDFFRHTRYGLQYVAEKAGFNIMVIHPDTGVRPFCVLITG